MPKTNMNDVVAALVESQKKTTELLQQLDRRVSAVLSMPDREHIDRGQAAPAAPERKLDLAERIRRAILQAPRDTAKLAAELGTSRTAVWAAIARLEARDEAIVVSSPGTRGRRGPSMVYHPSSPELAAKLRSGHSA